MHSAKGFGKRVVIFRKESEETIIHHKPKMPSVVGFARFTKTKSKYTHTHTHTHISKQKLYFLLRVLCAVYLLVSFSFNMIHPKDI